MCRDSEVLKGIAENTDHVEWHILRVMPRSERLAVEELIANGFEAYCPRVIIPIADKIDYTPLFSGYVFARRALNSRNAHPVYLLPHVYGWVTFGGDIAVVPQHLIEELRSRVANINSDGGLRHKYHIGELVKVTLFGAETVGTVTSIPKSQGSPINLLLEFMGREIRAQVPIYNVYPVDNTHMISRRSRGKGRWTRQYREIHQVVPASI